LKPERFEPWATDGWKIQAIARNVSGIIDNRPSTVANSAPKRMPR